MHRNYLPIAVALGLTWISLPSAHASPSSGEDPSPAPDGKIQLPLWIEGEFHECFDVRIWPDEVILWLEQENLRDLIADPETPEEERTALKQVLAQQNAWRTT
jgi:hypothetical protein